MCRRRLNHLLSFNGFSSAEMKATVSETSTNTDRNQNRKVETTTFLFGLDFTAMRHGVTGSSEETHNLLWGQSTVTVLCIMGASRHTAKHERGRRRQSHSAGTKSLHKDGSLISRLVFLDSQVLQNPVPLASSGLDNGNQSWMTVLPINAVTDIIIYSMVITVPAYFTIKTRMSGR